MVSGVDLVKARGKLLRLGGVTLEIMGETKPCERMDEAHAGLRAVMYERWRGGVFARVLNDGVIRVGDPVLLLDANAELFG